MCSVSCSAISAAASPTSIGSTGRRLTTAGNININQVDPKYLGLGIGPDSNVPNPFFGNPSGRVRSPSRATLARNQLLRPYPQFD